MQSSAVRYDVSETILSFIITIFFIPSENGRKPDGCGYRVIASGREKPESVASDVERLYACETVTGGGGTRATALTFVIDLDLWNLAPLPFCRENLIRETVVYVRIHVYTARRTYTLLYITYDIPRRPSSARMLPKGEFALRRVVTTRRSLYTSCCGWEWWRGRWRGTTGVFSTDGIPKPGYRSLEANFVTPIASMPKYVTHTGVIRTEEDRRFFGRGRKDKYLLNDWRVLWVYAYCPTWWKSFWFHTTDAWAHARRSRVPSLASFLKRVPSESVSLYVPNNLMFRKIRYNNDFFGWQIKEKNNNKSKKSEACQMLFHNKRVQKAYPVTRLFFFLFVNSLNIS